MQSLQTTSWTITVTNLGPDVAQDVTVSTGGGDQWTDVTSPTCGLPPCAVGNLANGASASVTYTGLACCLVPGESRDALVFAYAQSPTPDPNLANNAIENFVIKIIGPHRKG